MALPSSRILSRSRSVFSLADLVLDVQQVVLVFEARLLEGELLGGDLQLQRRIGQHDQRLAGLDLGAVFDQHLLDRAALVGGEIGGEEGRNRAAHRDVVLEWTFGDRADGQPVDRHAIDIPALPASSHAAPATDDQHAPPPAVQ